MERGNGTNRHVRSYNAGNVQAVLPVGSVVRPFASLLWATVRTNDDIASFCRVLHMDLGKSLHVGTIAEREFDHRLSLPVPTHDGGWVISFQDYPDVVILDAQLNEVQRLDLQPQSQQYCSTAVALSRDGK